MSEKTKKPLTKKTKVWILVAALAVILAAAVTAGALLLTGGGSPADPKVRWYNTEDKEFVIDTVDELYDMAYLSSKYDFEGQTIKLGADIVVNDGDASKWGETAPSRLWYPIKNFNGTFDGQGHTISGLYGISFNQEMGLFSNTGKDATVTNLRVTNTYIKSHGEHGTGVISSNGGGTFENIYVDAIIWSDNWNNGGIIGMVDMNGDTLISNCWFDGEMILVSDQGRVAGGIVGDVMPESGVVTIQHCLNTGNFSAEAITHTGRGRLMDIGGIVGRASGGTTNITDCFASTKIDSECVVGAGALIGAAGKGKTNLTHSYAVAQDNIKSLGHRYNQVSGDVYTYDKEYVTGFNSYKWTTLDFENFWAVDEDGTPVLKTFADKIPDLKNVKREIDYSWYTKRKTATISTIEQLRALHIISQWDNFSGKTIYLGADIVVQEGDASTWGETAPEVVWKGISSGTVMFAGTFDGLGHSVSGMYQKAPSSGLGLIVACTDGATVRNLKVLNSYFESTNVAVNNNTYSYIGSVSGYARGTAFSNIYSDAIMVSDGYYCGGIVGLMRNGKPNTVSNCWYDGVITMTGENTGMRGGGLVGCVWNVPLNVSHCLVTAEISSESWAWGANQGIVVGHINSKAVLTVEDTLSAGRFLVLDGKKDANGMICGRIAADATVTFDDVYAIRTPNPEPDPDAEKQWLCDWGLTGIRQAPVICDGPAIILDKSYLTGYNAYRYTGLDFKNFWAVDPEGHPVLQTFMPEGEEAPDLKGYSKAADYSWFTSAKDTYYLSTREQLVGFSLLASGETFKGKTICLANSISLNYGNAADWANYAPANKWIPVGNADVMFQGTFDGRGYTISGVYATGSGNGLGLFGMVHDATIKNLRLTNSFVRSNGVAVSGPTGKVVSYNYIGGIAAYAYNTTFDSIYTDAIVWNDGEMCGGIVGLINKVNAPVKINNCWFNGTIVQEYTKYKKASGDMYCYYYGGLIGVVRNVEVEITHCSMTGTMKGVGFPETTWGTVAGGMIGRIEKTGTNPAPKVTIKDSLSDTHIVGYPASTVGNSTIVGQCNKNSVLILDNVYAVPTVWRPVTQWQSKDLGSGDAVTVSVANLTGSKAYLNANLDYNNYWSALEGKIPQLKRFASGTVAEKVTLDTDWYDETQTEYVINTADELLGFAQLSKSNTFEGKTIKLGDDIVFNEGDSTTWGETEPAKFWISIGSAGSRFKGTFDGQGHTISGICYKSDGGDGTAMFDSIDGGTVKNFKLVNSYFDDSKESSGNAAWSRVAAIVATAYSGTVSDIYTDAYVSGGTMFNGGIVGLFRAPATTAATLTISNCWFDGNLDLGATGRSSGGILGGVVEGNNAYTTCNIENCLMTGTIDSQFVGEIDLSNYHMMANTGGLVGTFLNCKLNLKDNLVAGEMNLAEGATYCGSLYGMKNWGVSSASICEDVFVLDDVYSQPYYKNPENGHNNMDSWTDLSTVARDDMLGGMARNTAAGLDFTESGAWIAVADQLPELRLFSDAEEAPEVADPNAETTEWFDGTKTEYVINTLGEMKGFITLSQSNNFDGITIKLNTDIVWNEGDAATWSMTVGPNNTLKYIGSVATPFKGTFDGQGHTISGAYYASTVGGTYVGMFIEVENATIKNLIIENSAMHTSSGSGGNGILVGRAKGVTVENVKVAENVYASNSTYSGMVAYAEGANAVTFKNVWMAGNITSSMWMTRHGGLLGGMANTNGLVITVEDCLFTGKMNQTNTTTDAENHLGGFVGGTGSDVKVIVKNSLSAGTITKAGGSTVYTGSIVGISSWQGAAYATYENVYGTKECYVLGTSRDASKYTGTIGQPKTADILGGLARWNLPGLDFSETGAWIAVEGAIPELRYFSDAEEAPEVEDPNQGGTEPDPDEPVDPDAETTEWFDGTKTEYTITTAGELKGLATLAKTNNFNGITIKLGADVVLNEGDAADWKTTAPANAWTPIGTTTTKFAGTFDGQGYSISGLYNKATSTFVDNGLFGSVEGATIKNLVIKNSYIHGGNYNDTFVGAVAAKATSTTFENILIDKDVTVAGAMNLGSVVGSVDGIGGVAFKKCQVSGTVDVTGANAIRGGGLFGFPYKDARNIIVTDCLFDGVTTGVNTNTNASTATYAGGLFGLGNYANTITVTRCVTVGTVDATVNGGAGTIAGVTSGGGTAMYTDVYYVTGATPMGNPDKMKAGSVITPVELSALLGDEAKTTLTGFDFENIWVAVEGKTPVLKGYVASAEPDEPGIDPDVDPNEETTAWYDPTKIEYVISTVGEMKGFVTLSMTDTFRGKTVKLGADIVWNEGDAADWATTAPANVWTPIGDQDNGFLGTFDGQGHTVSGLYCVDIDYASFVARLYNPGMVKNVAVVNSYFRSNGTTKNYSGAGIVSRVQNASVSGIYTNAIFEAVWDAGIVASVPSGTSTITNCWFDGTVVEATRAGGILGFGVDHKVHTITDCLFTGSISGTNTGEAYYGGLVGVAPWNATITMTNCLAAGDMSGVTATMVGAVTGNNPGAEKSVYTNVYATTETHANLKGNGPDCAATAVAMADILGSAATTKITGFDFTNIWTTVDGFVPVLKAFEAFAPEAVDTTIETTEWYDATLNEYTISTIGELKGLATLAQTNNFSGKTIKLGADLVLNTGDAADWATNAPANAWNPIGTVDCAFAGTFDGQGHSISGLYKKGTRREPNGLFGYTNGATIKNLTVENSYISGAAMYSNSTEYNRAGAVVGGAITTNFEKIFIAEDVLVSSAMDLGGIAGYIEGSTSFKQCQFSGTVDMTGTFTMRSGSLFGFAHKNANIILTDCLFDGKITGENTNSSSYAGGLFSYGNFGNTITATRIVSVGTVDATAQAGVGSVTVLAPGGGNGMFTDVYYPEGTNPLNNPDKMKAGSVLTPVQKSALLGETAKTTLVGFDFENVWTYNEGALPTLTAFAD